MSGSELDQLERCYPAIAERLITGVLDFALQVRRDMGDVDKWIVFTEISLRFYNRPDVRGLTIEALHALDDMAMRIAGTNVRSIAEASGMARETVRRKAAELVRDGWVDQTGSSLSLSRLGLQNAGLFRRELIRLAQCSHAAVQSCRHGRCP